MTVTRNLTCLIRIFQSSLIIAGLASTLATAEESKPPSANFHGGVSAPVPNVNLPSSIPAADGELTIFADFENSTEGRVPLYRAKRTAEQIKIPSQDRRTDTR